MPVHFLSPISSATDLFMVFFVLLFPECHMVRIIQDVGSADWLLSFSGTHFRFLHIFSWLESPFFFFSTGQKSIVLMYQSLSIFLPKEILFAFKIWQLRLSCCKHLCAYFCVNLSFQLLWVNSKEHDYWIIY